MKKVRKQMDMTCAMNYYLASLIVLLLCVPGVSGLQAQQIVLTAGYEATGGTGSVSYSVGQVAFIYSTGTDGFVTEGVQQPFEILNEEGIEETNGLATAYSLYPNPATSYIILKIEKPEINNLSYQLYNMNGFLLKSSKIEDREISIRVDDLAPASYSLTVSENDKAIRTFIIIKK